MIARFAKDQSGAAFIEFGIMLPMLLLLFGVAVRVVCALASPAMCPHVHEHSMSRHVCAHACTAG